MLRLTSASELQGPQAGAPPLVSPPPREPTKINPKEQGFLKGMKVNVKKVVQKYKERKQPSATPAGVPNVAATPVPTPDPIEPATSSTPEVVLPVTVTPTPSVPIAVQEAAINSPKKPEKSETTNTPKKAKVAKKFRYPDDDSDDDSRENDSYRSWDRRRQGKDHGSPDSYQERGYNRRIRRDADYSYDDEYSDYSDDEFYSVPYRPCSASARRCPDKDFYGLPQPPRRPAKMVPPKSSRANAESAFHPSSEKLLNSQPEHCYIPSSQNGYNSQSAPYLPEQGFHAPNVGYLPQANANYPTQSNGYPAQSNGFSSQAAAYPIQTHPYSSNASNGLPVQNNHSYSMQPTPNYTPEVSAGYPPSSQYPPQGNTYIPQSAAFPQANAFAQHMNAGCAPHHDQWQTSTVDLYPQGMNAAYQSSAAMPNAALYDMAQPAMWNGDIGMGNHHQQQQFVQGTSNAKVAGWGLEQTYATGQTGLETYRLQQPDAHMMGMPNNPEMMWAAANGQRRRSMPTM